MLQADTFTQRRISMVNDQIKARGIRDERVLRAMETVPRHLFVPGQARDMAYNDGPLPIGEEQTISQPYIVALMTELVGISESSKVLEIGTGSGYQAAVLSLIVAQVYTVEYIGSLSAQARRIFTECGYNNIHAIEGDGSVGLTEFSPYHAILVTAAAPDIPQSLLNQLDEGGVLVAPIGSYRMQMLVQFTRKGSRFKKREITPVAFVPLVGEQGWRADKWRL